MKLFAYNVGVAVLAMLAFLPFWFIRPSGSTTLPLIQAGVEILSVPVILTSLNLLMYVTKKLSSLVVPYLMMSLACMFGVLVAYFNWGITSGRLFRPDGETVDLTLWSLVFSPLVAVGLWCIVHITLRIIHFKSV